MRLIPLPVLVALCVLPARSSAGATAGDDWLGEDKAKHFAACFTLAGAGYGGGALLFEAPETRWLTGAGLAMGAGLGKELYDSRRGGTGFSFKDMSWNVVGTATGLGVAYLVDRLVFGGREEPGPRALLVPGGRGGGASRPALDEPHELLALEARVHPQHGAIPAVAAGDEHGDLPSRALVHAARGQHADLLGQATLGERPLEPARQVHAPASRPASQEALAADEHLHRLHRSTASLVPHSASSSSRPRAPRDAPLRAPGSGR
jgi:uncharacterized protein YfiM (DUF2279 family)